jgi:hypothetical protein
MARRPSPLRALFAVALAAPGCGAADLSQTWQLDRLRVLGVQAEPAEIAPGEATALSSLVYVPTGARLDAQIWFACLPTAADDFGCALDTSALDAFAALDPATATPEELAAALEAAQEAGLIGLEPFLSPRWVAPPNALDGLSAQEAREGVSALVNLSVASSGPDAGEDDLELVYKRVPVSLATTPNHNPLLIGLAVDGDLRHPEAETLVVKPGAEVEIEPILSPDTIEDYVYITTDGEEEQRTEEPYFTWYAEGGGFEQAISLYPDSARAWTAPETVGFEGVIAVVVRDRRGGMHWTQLQVRVE